MAEAVATGVFFASALLSTDLPAWLLFGFDPGCPKYFYPGYIRLGALEIGTLALLYLTFSRGGLRVGRKDVFAWALGGIGLFSWTSVLWARSHAAAVCGSTSLSFYLLWAFLLARGGLDGKKLTRALLWSGAAAGTMCAWGCLVAWVRSGEPPYRFDMPASHPNELPGLVLAGLFLALDRALISARAKDGRGFARACALASPMVFALLASRSKSGLLALAAGGVALAALRAPPRARKLVLGGVLVCALAGLGLVSTPHLRRAIRPTTAGARLILWKWAARAHLSSPFVGHGRGSFPVVGREYSDPPDLVHPALRGRIGEAHSMWLREAAETGVAGLGLLALGFGWALVSGWRKRSAVFPGLVALLALASLNPTMPRWEAAPFVWAAAGICASSPSSAGREPIAWKKALLGALCACLCIVPLVDQAAHSELGKAKAFCSSGEDRAALGCAERAEYSFHYSLARRAALVRAGLLLRMGEKSRAREAVSDYLSAAPSDVDLAVVASRAADGLEALRPLLRALGFDPYSEVLERRLSEALKGVTDEELRSLEAGADTLVHLRALRLASLGRWQEAVSAARRSRHPRAPLVLARALIETGAREEASKLLDGLVAREPFLAEAFLLRAATRGGPGEAVADLRAAHAVRGSPETAVSLARALAGAGRGAEAKELLEGVLRWLMRPDARSAPAWEELARLYAGTGDEEGLARLVKKARFYAGKEFAQKLESAAGMLY